MIKLIVTEDDSIILYSTYHYDERLQLIKESEHNPQGMLVESRFFSYDKNGNTLTESMQKEGSDTFEYKYNYQYDTYNNCINQIDLFSNGESNEFGYSYTYDNYGNWITQLLSRKGVITDFYRREIKYK